MSMKSVVAVPVLLLMAGIYSGAVVAEGEAGMSDEKFCEQEARQEGLSDADEVKDYVTQCLQDIGQENAGSGAEE